MNEKTFSSASVHHSQMHTFAYSRPLGCDWLGGSVMLADVSFVSSHCSATLTVTFDCILDQEVQASYRILRCLKTLHTRERSLFSAI